MIQVELDATIAHIRLNRPEKRNAMDGQFVRDLTAAFTHAESQPNTHLIVLSAEGPDFCAGADLAWMQKMSASDEACNLKDARELAELIALIYHARKPVIVLTQGMSLGGGLGLVAAADIVIAAEDASFCFSEVKIGLTPAVISPYVIAAIGARAARYYFLTAEKFDANEALRLGLVHRIVPAHELKDAGLTLAKRLLTYSPHALKAAKALTHWVGEEKISGQLTQATAEHLAKMRKSDDAQEGLHAFLEKRMPVWPTGEK